MTRKSFMPAIVLTAIAVVVAALLALVNILTAPIIEEANFAAMKESLLQVMPNGDFDPNPDTLKDNAPDVVKAVYTDKNGGGKVVVLVTNKGYTGKEIGITVGVDNDGKITDVKITKNEESIVPPSLKPGGSYGDAYRGAGADDIAELETGATVKYTESAIKGAISDALAYLGYGDASGEAAEVLPKTDSEILALANELNPMFGELEAMPTEELGGFVKRLYCDKGGKGYFAYIVTSTEWNPLEAELGVAFDSSGKVSAVRLLSWNLSPTYEHNDIPGDSFVAGFVGKDTSGVENTELITHVTQTSGRVRDAILAVSKAVSLPTSEAEIATIAKGHFARDIELVGEATDGLDEFVKRLYKLSDGTGYVAYIITRTDWNPHEAEAVVSFDKNGKVIGIELISWNLSPTYEHNDIPGDAFAESLVGKDESTLPSVELITHVTQTSGRLRDSVLSVSKAVSLPKTEAEIFAIADELIGYSGEYSDVTGAEPPEFVKRVYRSERGEYVAYIVTNTQWNPLEAELVAVYGATGEIVGIKLLSWNLSPTYEHNDIPGESFVMSFVGKTANEAQNIELVTHVTETSGRVRRAIYSASTLMEFREPQGARVTGIIILISAVLAVTGVVIFKRRKRI